MHHRSIWISRRALLATTAMIALVPPGPLFAAVTKAGSARALPLDKVRLLPSIYDDAVAANRRYLMALEPELEINMTAIEFNNAL